MSEIKNFISKALEPAEEGASDWLEVYRESIDNLFADFLSVVLDDNLVTKDEQFNYTVELHRFYRLLEEDASKPWLFGKKKIAFVGKFSAGKSSVINRLLGGDFLPVDLAPTTAVPTYVLKEPQLYGKFFVVNYTNKVSEFDISLLKNLTKDVVDSLHVPLPVLFKYFVVSPPIQVQRVPEDVILIDTPGYNPGEGKGSWDRATTIEAINDSDAVVFVIDVNDGDISRDALEFIKKYVKDKKLLVLVNKCDLKPPMEVEEVVEQVRDTLETSEIECANVIPFSARKSGEEDVDRIFEILSGMFDERDASIHKFFTYIKSITDTLIDRAISDDSKEGWLENLRNLYSRIEDVENAISRALIGRYKTI